MLQRKYHLKLPYGVYFQTYVSYLAEVLFSLKDTPKHGSEVLIDVLLRKKIFSCNQQ